MTFGSSIKPEDMERYRAAARRRAAARVLAPAEAAARAELLRRVRSVATTLKTRFGATRVILFGSLAHGAWYAADSDVDLAVEGLSADEFWRAWSVAEAALGVRRLDLIDLEAAGEPLRRAIEHHGVPL